MVAKRVTIESHPWVLARRNAKDLHFKTKLEAVRYCEQQLSNLKQRLLPYDSNVAIVISDIFNELSELPEEGGWIESVVDEYTGAKFDAHIYRRA